MNKRIHKARYLFMLLIIMIVTDACSSFRSGQVREKTYAELADAAWSWWSYPQIIETSKGNAVFGFVSSEEGQGVGFYDSKTGKIVRHMFGTECREDDHNAPAVSALPDGRLLVIYATGHNEDRYMHVWIGRQPEDISSWNEETLIEASGETTYAQIFQYDGKIFLFYRINHQNSKSDRWIWVMRTSTDGKDWSEEKRIVYALPQYYCLFRETTTDGILRLVMASNPAREDTDFRSAYLNLNDYSLYKTDNVTRIKELDQNPLAFTDFEIIQKKPDKYQTQRLFDVAVTEPSCTILAFAGINHLPSEDYVADYCIYKNGSVVKVFSSDKSFLGQSYFGGMSFIGRGTDIRQITSYAREGYDHIVISDLDANDQNESTEKNTEVIEMQDNQKIRLIRPVVSPGGQYFMYQKGEYDSDSYTDFMLNAKIMKMP